MANTTNFGWETPDDTDLVKDGAAAIRTLGSAIDTSLVDLKGGTTGQVLSKASNTDMDFTWSSVDPLTILDAKGDLISATAADTPARLAVGADGTYLQADSTTSTGLKWATVSSGGMTSLATGTLSGTDITISSISSSYFELLLFINNPYNATGDGLNLRVNGDTGSNYRASYMTIGGTSVQAPATTNAGIPLTGAGVGTSSTSYAGVWVRIPNYASTTAVKSVFFTQVNNQNNGGSGFGLWNSASAITSLTIRASGASITGGTYTLYGVK